MTANFSRNLPITLKVALRMYYSGLIIAKENIQGLGINLLLEVVDGFNVL